MKSQKLIYNIIVLLVLVLLIESYINHYHYLFNQIIPVNSTYNTLEKYSASHAGMDLIKTLIWEENGLVESIQILFLLFSIYYFYLFLKNENQLDFLLHQTIKIIFFLGIIYYFLEEISWGQHFFNWKSPLFFINLNEQKETNLHNISNLFNQLPRNLILIWSSLTFLIIKLKFINSNKSLSFFLYPSDNLKKISYLILFFTMPNLFFENYFNLANIIEDNIAHKATLVWNGVVAISVFDKIKIVIFDFLNFKFVRISELQELLFSYYIFLYSYNLKKNTHSIQD